MSGNRLLLFFKLCFLLAIPTLAYGAGKNKPKATDGLLNLEAYSFAQDGPVALDGIWEFYYGRFVPPEAFKTPPIPNRTTIPVPDSWNHHGFAAAGFATYRLRIKIAKAAQADELLSLRLDTAGTAYTLYINGQASASAGKPGESLQQSSGSYKVLTIPLKAQNGEIDLVFHISNYLHRSGGLWFSHHLGTPEQITRMREKGLFADFILLGALFIIGFYHISLFLHRRREIAVLHFGLFCLMVALRVPLTGEFFLTQLLPDFSLSVQLRLEYITVYITPIFMISFIAHSFAEKTKKFILYSSRFVCLLFSSSLFFLSPIAFTGLIGIFDIFLITFVVWVMVVMAFAVHTRKENALVSLLLLLILGATLANDLLFSMEYIYTTSLLPYGLILFVFVQAVLLSRKFYQAFRLSENLSETLITTNHDLTQLKENLETKVTERTDDLRQKNGELAEAVHTREKFLSIIAHDLRSPLIGMTRIFEGAASGTMQLDEKMIPALAKTTRESVHLLENMLSWAISQKEQLRVFPDNIDLLQVCQKNAALIEHVANEKQITLLMNVPADLWVHVDGSMLETVMRNLLGNAIKFTPPRGEIRISAHAHDGGVRIEVSDTGPGVSADKVATLFNSKERRRSSLGSSELEGSGLGLFICKEFVEANGGTIGAANRSGKGTVFWFDIPLGIAEKKSAETHLHNADVLPGLKALVVEDNALHLRLVEAVLAELRVSSETAIDGQIAWERLQKESYDFILLDGSLPQLDGFTLAAKLMAQRKKPFVIFHSSFSPEEIRARAQPGSFDAIVAKPLDRDALVQILGDFYGKA